MLYSGSAGRIGLDPSSGEFDTDSLVWLASMTKIVTATCVMRLVERGRIALDDDVRGMVLELADARILRGFQGDEPILEENTWSITLR